MNAATLEPRPWSRRRWWTLIAVVFAAHVGLIVALGNRKSVTPRPPSPSPTFRLVAENEFIELNDPTLFALPHRRGFSGTSWLRIHEVKFEPFRWIEPPRLLSLPVEKLADTFAHLIQTNALAPFELEIKPAPELARPVAPEVGVIPLQRSTLRLAGGLSNRRLLNPPQLPLQPWTDLLTNSVVQIVVSAEGYVISPPTLLARCGSEKADQLALSAAKSARFERIRNGQARPTIGAMIFEWYSVPLIETNAAPQNQ